jgi:cytochrome b involved in lipid metabolism
VASIEKERNNKKKIKWVIYETLIYNISDYLDLHPGGSDMIEPFI